MPNKTQFNSNKEYLHWYHEYRIKNAEKLRIYHREYTQKYRAKNGYYNEINSKKRYPEKEKARWLFHYAIKIGKLKKNPCVVCGNVNSQGHHKDYFFPLNVVWLCPLHHAEKHKKVIHTLRCCK